MLADEAKEIVHRFGQVWTAGGLSVLDTLAAPDIVVFYAGMPEPIRSAEGFRQFLSDEWYAGLPDVQRTEDELLAEGGRVAARWTCRGTHEGDLFGVPATGKSVSLSGISIYRIIDGKVVEENGVSDLLGLLQQLGAHPPRPA